MNPSVIFGTIRYRPIRQPTLTYSRPINDLLLPGCCICLKCQHYLLLRPGRGAKYCDEYVCLFVRLSAQVTWKLRDQTSPIFVHVACGNGSVLLWQRGDALCTSGFVDDVMFSYYWVNRAASSNDVMLKRVRQVAVLVGHQTTSVFGWVGQNAAPGKKSAIYDWPVLDVPQILLWRYT